MQCVPLPSNCQTIALVLHITIQALHHDDISSVLMCYAPINMLPHYSPAEMNRGIVWI